MTVEDGYNTDSNTPFFEAITGKNGLVTISGTDATTPGTKDYFTAFVIVEDVVFTAVVGNFTGFAGITYPAGHVILCRATSVTLASGILDAYEGD